MAIYKGHQSTIEVSNDGSTWQAVGQINSIDWPKSRKEHDVTDIDAEHEKKETGIKQQEATLQGFYDPADAGQAILIARLQDNANIWIRHLFDGTNGWSARGRVSEFKLPVQAGETTNVTYKWVPNSDWTVI